MYYRERESAPNDPETIIGPYNFDCVIPMGARKLIIECQGDYWHSRDKAIRTDRSKAIYIERYYPDCELKYLWEHEFQCKDRIVATLKYWLGIDKLDVCDFNFSDVIVTGCNAKDYKLLLSKYHYLPNAGRGGIAYGAFLGDELIAVCVFSPLVRQNLPWDKENTRELSRLCIHPRYQKKNFASWFVSRCIKFLDPKYRTIISYCDTTFNHDGAAYKACNFRLDGDVPPDYWYVAEDGWIMHKKTLYQRATKMSMKEKEYAEKFGYKRVYGSRKLRFIYDRDM
jgi:GNAT superfamily N-acetyltransferase